ncbi:hypothetical protein H733_0604 [Haemophilus influenzae CGSHiCZ412602]|nr:hypothetical protein H733_0604 [Haemophilus influenzae CGSHiCZ412602]AVI99405.1 hypothetical protein BV121_793 [Haemophilus influenzae]AVJ01255.1 hypothetical protein BV122_797 [Haemophilus influenzae]
MSSIIFLFCDIPHRIFLIKKCGKNLLRFFTALFTGRLMSW